MTGSPDTPDTLGVLVALLVAGIVTPAMVRLHRRLAARRPATAHDRDARRRRRPARPLRRAVARLPRTRRRQPTAEAVATWCDSLARPMRAGDTLRDALCTSGSTNAALERELEAVRHGLERGEPIEVALDRCRCVGGHLALGLAVIGTTARLGGPSSQPLERVAAALRLRAADEQERMAHSAQARMSAHVLTLVPLGFLGLMLTLDADVRDAATTRTGAALIAAGLLLNGLGWFWMRAAIGRETIGAAR